MATKPANTGSAVVASTAKTVTTAWLTVGVELAMLGVATLVAASSEGAGQVMLVFMIGLMLLFLIHHTAFTGAIPNLFKMIPATATN